MVAGDTGAVAAGRLRGAGEAGDDAGAGAAAPAGTLAGERLGAPVTIGSLRGYLDGVVPVFVLQDLEVAAPDADDAPLTLQHVELAIDVGASIWSRSLRLRQLWVRGLDLHLVRDGEGSIRLRGWRRCARTMVPMTAGAACWISSIGSSGWCSMMSVCG